MAGPLKRYGQYFVFAAMATTGVFVWNSNRRDLNGESYAELYNAAAERMYVGLSGEYDEAPDWDGALTGYRTNLFPSAILSGTLIDEAMECTVRALLSIDTDGGKADIPGPGVPMWLLGGTNLLYDGSVDFVTNDCVIAITPDVYDSYSGRTYTKYDVAIPTQYRDGAMTSSTTRYTGLLPFSFPPFDTREMPLTNQPLASLVTSSYLASQLGGFTFTLPESGCAWNTNLGERAFYFYAEETPLDRVIRRRDLLAIAGVLSNLTVSVAEVPTPSTVQKEYETPGGSVSLSSEDYVAEDAYLQACHNSATNLVYSNPSGLMQWEYSFQYTYEVDVEKTNTNVVTWDRYQHTYYKMVNTPTNFTAGQFFGYPSAYAVTNGYVARLRVFAVFRLGVYPYSELPYVPHANLDPYTEASFSDSTRAYTLSEFGGVTFNKGLSTDGLPQVARVSSISDIHGYANTSQVYVRTKLALLYDKENPSSTNDLMWSSVTMPTLSISGPPSVHESGGYEGLHYDESIYWNDYLFARTSGNIEVDTEAVFVVVDWNWKHLNPANPYVPPE